MGIYKLYKCFRGEERLEELGDICCNELGTKITGLQYKYVDIASTTKPLTAESMNENEKIHIYFVALQGNFDTTH